MFKLTKSEASQRESFVTRLQDAAHELETAVNDFNTAMEEPRAEVERALNHYNEVLAAAREFAEGIATRAEEEIGEKSESWQDGEKGQAAKSWQEEWSNLYLEDVELEFPEELSFEEPEHATDLESISEDVAEAA